MANAQTNALTRVLTVDPAVAERAAKRYYRKSTPISKSKALKIGKDYATLVRSRVDPDALVFVFGSTVTGEANPNSDIDIAVVSKQNDAAIYDAFANLQRRMGMD